MRRITGRAEFVRLTLKDPALSYLEFAEIAKFHRLNRRKAGGEWRLRLGQKKGAAPNNWEPRLHIEQNLLHGLNRVALPRGVTRDLVTAHHQGARGNGSAGVNV